MTGWGSGYCGGAPYPRGFSRGSFGGRQGGFGRGQGRRNRFWATGRPGWLGMGDSEGLSQRRDAAAERQDLEQETAALEAELQRLRARIEEFESPASE